MSTKNKRAKKAIAAWLDGKGHRAKKKGKYANSDSIKALLNPKSKAPIEYPPRRVFFRRSEF